MGLIEFFLGKRRNDLTANVAKERLSVVIAHERSARSKKGGNTPEYLPKLKQELLDVIRKYAPVQEEDVDVRVEKSDNCDILELNINLSEHV